MLMVAPLAAVLAVVFGTILGMIMGYYRGWVDNVLSRIVEAFLALPVVMVGLFILTLADTSAMLDAISFVSATSSSSTWWHCCSRRSSPAPCVRQ